MTTYADAAASIAKTPITLATITLNYPDEQVLRVATTGYTDADGNYYEAMIKTAPTITTKIANPFGGQAQISAGSMALINVSDLDEYVDYSWVGASVTVKFGFAEIADADFKTVFTGYISACTMAETSITISLQSAGELLEQTIIPADEYADQPLPDRVSWILGLAGITAESTSWSTWSANNDYTTRFHTTAEMTAASALQALLFGSVWGVGQDGLFFVYDVSEASGTADAVMDEVEILAWSRKALSQYYRVSAMIPDVDLENRENLLPSASSFPYLPSSAKLQPSGCSALGFRETHWFRVGPSIGYSYFNVTMDGFLFHQHPHSLPGDIFTGDSFWQPDVDHSLYAGGSVTSELWDEDWDRTKIHITIPDHISIDGLHVWLSTSSSETTPSLYWMNIPFSEMSIFRKWTMWGVDVTEYVTDMSYLPANAKKIWFDIIPTKTHSFPENLDIELEESTQIDTWGIHASGISSIKLQYWDDTTETWIDANAQTGESTICTGGVAWFTMSGTITATKWRISVLAADADCKIYRVKFCDTTQDIETITKELSSVLDANPLAKASSTTKTYIKAVDEAEDVIERAMSLRSAARTLTTVTARNQCGLRSIYDVVELDTERWSDRLYRVTGITETLATGETKLELFA